ncbi:unnamed protein product, partial [Rotaria sp. Silwood2]
LGPELSKIALLNNGRDFGDNKCRPTETAPADSPNNVIRCGSPNPYVETIYKMNLERRAKSCDSKEKYNTIEKSIDLILSLNHARQLIEQV